MANPISSMTGFGRSDGTLDGFAWVWELRSVNGRTLDVRLRLPPGFDALEQPCRDAAAKLLRRGNVNATLTVKREEQPRSAADPAVLDAMLSLALGLAARIPGCPPPRAEGLLGLPGVFRATAATVDEAVLAAQTQAVRDGFATALEALVAARQAEGARTGAVVATEIDDIAGLHATATAEAADQPAAQRARMLEAVRALMAELPALPEERIAQEVAILASRSDVREELDRLAGHIEAARALLAEGVNIGRRLDFLVQEFNREANTLCSKSASPALTATGLKLKAAIEQVREQVANIE